MDSKTRTRVHLDCLYEMFRDKVEENVIYIVYSENDGKMETTIDQLMSIAACSFTGHLFSSEPKVATEYSLKNSALANESLQNALTGSNVVSEHNKSVLNETIDRRPSSTGEENESDLDEEIERLQNSIDELLLEKKSSHDKASRYLSKKMFSVTTYYSELASQIRRMIEEKTNRLVELLLKKSQDSDSVDLHGLNPIQASLVVSELLKTRQHKLMIDKQGEASIDIITGWGKHSANQGQRIRPTIVALLREKGFEYYRLNKGALRVTIKRF